MTPLTTWTDKAIDANIAAIRRYELRIRPHRWGVACFVVTPALSGDGFLSNTEAEHARFVRHTERKAVTRALRWIEHELDRWEGYRTTPLHLHHDAG